MPERRPAEAGGIAATSRPAASEATPAGHPRGNRWRPVVALLGTVLFIGLAGVAIWLRAWLPLQAQLAGNASRLSEHAQRLDALSAWQGTASEDLVALENRQQILSHRVDQLGPERLAAWSLAEADYLLSSAGRAATFDYDPARAALALQLAGDALAPVAGSGRVRRSIADARAVLEAARVPDVGVLGDELGRAAQSLQEAGLREPGAASPPAAAPPPGWRGTVQQAWRQLSDVIVVQRVGTPVQPLLRPEETQYLHQQLGLKVTAAQFALQRRDNEAFRRELADLQAWAEAYLDTAQPATRGALDTLVRLAGVDLRPSLPDLSAAREQLSELRRASAAGRGP